MEIKMIKIEDLKPYPNNPRFNDEAVEYVANSIKEFGFKVPMIIDKNNEIVAGHTRYKASLELGLKEVPCIIADDLSEEQIKAFRLADNKVSEKSQWNFDLLEEELNDILNIDMSEFDFDNIDPNALDTDFELPDGDKGNMEQMTFTLTNEQAELIRGALDLIKPEDIQETFGNTNKNGNAIYEVVKEWVEQKT
jgi:ParB-like chromosome segregation protein Spo0J